MRPLSVLQAVLAELAAHTPRTVDDPGRRQAAVALLLAPGPDRLFLIRRADREGDPWSGHLALPGGRRDPADADLLATAIRETQEETGIVLERNSCLATLDDLAPVTPSLPPVLVRPFVFLASPGAQLTLSHEVTSASWVAFSHLVTPGVYGKSTVSVRGVERSVDGYRLEEGLLWGMTERILTPVLQRWERLSFADH